MAMGFSRKSPSKSQEDFTEDDVIDDDDFDFGGDLDLDLDNDAGNINSPIRKNNSNSIKRPAQETSSNATKIIIACVSVAVVVLVIVGIILFIGNSKKKKANEEALRLQQEQQLQNNQNTTDETVKAGVPNLYANNKDTNNSTPVASDVITTNLNNLPVETNYKIKDIKTVTDFVNYEKYRAQTAAGLEFYWLEVTYKERPYKVQVPLSIYKELETKGITVVDAEVTVLEDKSEIITYMSVRKDAKSKLEKER